MGRRDHFYDMINLQSLWNSDRFPIQLQVVSHELGDFKSLISRDVVENLCGSAGRPIYLQRRDSFCFCQPDRLLKWIASEAASRADVAIDRHGFFSSCSNLDPRSNRSAIGFLADEFQRQPVVLVPWILEENVVILIARNCSSHLNK